MSPQEQSNLAAEESWFSQISVPCSQSIIPVVFGYRPQTVVTEMEGILYISTPRPGAKCGGGAGIAFCSDRFTFSKLNVFIPNHWRDIKKIILCSVYSPPNSRKNNLLIDHISITYNTLKIQHPEAEIIICGDKNNLDEKKIISLDHNFRQVTTPGKTSGCIQLSQTYAAMITHQL